MTRATQRKTLLLTALVALGGAGFAGQAQAGERYCREYTEQVRISGKIGEAYGTACLQEDGDWKIVVAARPDGREDTRNYAYRDRDYDRRDYEPVRVVVREAYHPPRVIYVYDSPRRFVPPGQWKKYHTYNRWHDDRYDYYDRYDRYDGYHRHGNHR